MIQTPKLTNEELERLIDPYYIKRSWIKSRRTNRYLYTIEIFKRNRYEECETVQLTPDVVLANLTAERDNLEEAELIVNGGIIQQLVLALAFKHSKQQNKLQPEKKDE